MKSNHFFLEFESYALPWNPEKVALAIGN